MGIFHKYFPLIFFYFLEIRSECKIAQYLLFCVDFIALGFYN